MLFWSIFLCVKIQQYNSSFLLLPGLPAMMRREPRAPGCQRCDQWFFSLGLQSVICLVRVEGQARGAFTEVGAAGGLVLSPMAGQSAELQVRASQSGLQPTPHLQCVSLSAFNGRQEVSCCLLAKPGSFWWESMWGMAVIPCGTSPFLLPPVRTAAQEEREREAIWRWVRNFAVFLRYNWEGEE